MYRICVKNLNFNIGRITVFCTDDSIIRLIFENGNWEAAAFALQKYCGKPEYVQNTEAADQCITELTEYFIGKRREFSIKTEPYGTDYEKKIWAALQTVPYGKTISYSQLAEKAGVKGARAVGNAVGRNPIPILIPCHRIIRSNGELGGFSPGLAYKIKLLSLEGAEIPCSLSD